MNTPQTTQTMQTNTHVAPGAPPQAMPSAGLAVVVGETYLLNHGDWQETVCVRAIVKAGRGRAVHYVPVDHGYYAGKLPEKEFQRIAHHLAG